MRKRLYFLVSLSLAIVLARYVIGRYELQQQNTVTEIFMIRGFGSSHMDFNFKFILVLALMAMILYDWKND